jgi:hypothetical protein
MKNKAVMTAALAGLLVLGGASGAQAAAPTANAKYVHYVHAHDAVTRNVPAKTLTSFGKLLCSNLRAGATKQQLISASPKGATRLLMKVSIKAATKYLCPDV